MSENKSTRYCPHCGAEISPEAVLCVHCGRLLNGPQPQAQTAPAAEVSEDFSVIGYDICGLLFCFYPMLAALVGIDYSNANDVVWTALGFMFLSFFPLAISLITIFNKNIKFKVISYITLASTIILFFVYFVVFIFGIASGGKLE